MSRTEATPPPSESPPDRSQRALPLQSPRHTASSADSPLIPARIVNEFVYCPRLAYLEWVQKEWRDSSDTIEGTYAHRRADRQSGELPSPEALLDGDTGRITALELTSERLGVTCKLDVLEASDGRVTPVDYKRGRRPHVARAAYDPERVQLCVQGLLLEEVGYRCESGVLYYVASRERVVIEFDAELRELTHQSIDLLRDVVDAGKIPPPLEDSPKCPRCALVSICLPDETGYLQNRNEAVRPLAVERTQALPVYVQATGGKVAKRGDRIEISVDDEVVAHARLGETSRLIVFGNVYVTTPTIHELMRRDIPITWHSHGGWFMGHTIGTGHNNVELRTAQYRASFDERISLQIARTLVRSKIRNCRTLLRRHGTRREVDITLGTLRDLGNRALRARDAGQLLGIEGAAAAAYFPAWGNLLDNASGTQTFDFAKRNRRPPTDPVNALLSFCYALLTNAWTTTLSGVGFDVYRGFYHQPRFGRPSLALDLMEPFRPLLADSTVMRCINNGEVSDSDFTITPIGVNLTAGGRKAVIAAFEARLEQEITHPVFGYRLSYRRVLELEARLLGRFVTGEIDHLPEFTTR